MAVSLTHTTVAVGTDAGNGEIAKAQWNQNHTLTAAVDNLLGTTSLSTSVVEIPCTSAGRALLDDADAAAQRTTLSAAGTGVSNTFTANQIISVTDNANAALRVTQLGTGEAIRVEDSTNPDATPFVVDSSGRVGIGVSPTTRLDIYGPGSGDPAIRLSDGTVDYRTYLSGGQAYSYTLGAHAYEIGTNNTARMRIRSDGNVGIGGTGSAVVSLSVQKDITGGTTAVGADVAATVQSDVTSTALGYNTTLATQATTFTTNIQHYRASQGTFGAGSTVAAQYGFNSTGSLIGATANYGFISSDTSAVTTGKTAYGFYSNINTATGGGTTYGFYAAGTALNYFGGQVQLAAGSQTSAALAGSSDPNTGLFFPAADTVAFTTGGTERLRINSTGQVGINVTPTAEFDLNGNYAANIVAMAALDVDCSAGNYFTKTINANSTFTFSNVPASRSYSFTLELTHTSGTVTWPTTVKWPGDTTPSLTTGKTHLFMFVTDDGGTRWRGASLTNYTN